jgi:hypothetical protein
LPETENLQAMRTEVEYIFGFDKSDTLCSDIDFGQLFATMGAQWYKIISLDNTEWFFGHRRNPPMISTHDISSNTSAEYLI